MSTVKDAAYVAPAALTITLASLANGSGRQSTEVDNTVTRHQKLLVSVNIMAGTTPTVDSGVYVHLIRDDNAASPIRDDGAGAADAAITVRNAPVIGVLTTPATTGYAMKGSFVVDNPGPKWAIAVVNNTGVALNATPANHVIEWQPLVSEF